MRHRTTRSVIALAMGLALSSTASALQIDVTATDNGNGNWTYLYQLSDQIFEENEGFTIFFDYSLYAALTNPVATSASDWHMLALNPDLSNQLEGLFDGLALNRVVLPAVPSVIGQFSIKFEWLGGTNPVPLSGQRFETYRLDAIGNLETTGTGTVGIAAIPTPAPLALLVAGLAGLGLSRSRRTAFATPSNDARRA